LSKNSLDSFIKNYDINKAYDEYLQSINATLKDSRKRYAKQFQTSKKAERTIKEYLKSTIASQIYGDDGFYRVIQSDDKMLQKVLELESNN